MILQVNPRQETGDLYHRHPGLGDLIAAAIALKAKDGELPSHPSAKIEP